MHDHRPSLTATLVSFARGAASSGSTAPCFDPVAASLVPAPFTQLLRLMDGSRRRRKLMEPALRALSFGLMTHLELRTALLDAAVEDAVRAGVRQVVLLGAGLDSRAWRMSALAETDVIELDHPNTQQWKTERVSRRRPTARSVEFVAVDFERTTLGEALDASSFRRDVPTMWIWEGVTSYLHPAAIEATVTAIAERSAPGSRLALTYVTPEVLEATRMRPLIYPVFKLISEPLHGILSRERLRGLLEAHAFEVLQDELPSEAGARFGRPTSRGFLTPAERVVVARKL